MYKDHIVGYLDFCVDISFNLRLKHTIINNPRERPRKLCNYDRAAMIDEKQMIMIACVYMMYPFLRLSS
jgi:hypothetical protein